jgi:hypothetical protein
MADTGAAGTGQESTQGNQQQGQESAANDQQGQQGGTGQESGAQGAQGGQEFNLESITDPALKSYLETQIRQAAEARREAASYRTKAQEAAAKVEEFQRANETAEQKAEREAQEHQQRLATLEAENKALKIGGQWTTAAAAAKALDPAALLVMVGGADKIELDENGKAANLDALLKDARQQYPWAFARAANSDAGAGGDGASGPAAGGMNDFIRSGGTRR